LIALVKGLDVFARGWLWLTVILMPAIAIAGGLGFQAVGFLIGVSALLVWAVERSGAAYLRSLWAPLLLGFLFWAWLSTLWSSHVSVFFLGNASTLVGLMLTLFFMPLVFFRLSNQMKSALIWAVIIAGGVGAAFMLFDAVTGFALSMWVDPVDPGGDIIQRRSDAEMNLGRGQVSYTQLAWPIIALMILKIKRGWMVAGLFLIALSVSTLFNELNIVIPTLIISAGFALLAWCRPKLGVVLAFSVACASLAFAPIIGLVSSHFDAEFMRQLPLSWEHRLRMWAYSVELIQQSPIIGHGFDSSRAFDQLTFLAPDGRNITVISMHPHNIGLQIWLETGLIGVVLFCAFVGALVKPILRVCQSPARAMAAAGLISATATCGSVSIGIWQHWWWALIIFSACLIILLPENHSIDA